MTLFTGSAIWLTNKLRKWTEMYGLKMFLRNVRHSSRTRRFWCHIRVLFIVLAPVQHIVLSWTDIRKSKMAPKTGNGKTFCRNNIFVKFQPLYLHFRGRPIHRTCPTHMMFTVKNGACKPEIEIASDKNKIFVKLLTN